MVSSTKEEFVIISTLGKRVGDHSLKGSGLLENADVSLLLTIPKTPAKRLGVVDIVGCHHMACFKIENIKFIQNPTIFPFSYWKNNIKDKQIFILVYKSIRAG